MKTPIKVISISFSIAAALALTALTTQAQNLLSDPNFASGTAVPSGMGGWSTFNNAAFSTNFTFGPTTFSMEDSGHGGFSVPGSFQYDAATPGTSYLFTGYAYVPSTLPPGTSEGFLQITFVDSTTHTNLGTVQTSPGNALVSNVVNSNSVAGTWIFLSEIATAPAGTAYAEPFTLVLDQNPTTVYFDELSLTVVPEPSSLALLGIGLAGLFYIVRRHKVAASLAR